MATITENKGIEISADILEEIGEAYKTASKYTDGVFFNDEKLCSLGELLLATADLISELNHKIGALKTDLKITEEFARDDKIELSDDDKELLKGMGIKVEE